MNNFNQFLKQAQEVQAKMQASSEAIEAQTFEGKAGGNIVHVTVNGKGAMTSVKLEPTILKPEDVGLIEDLIVAAYNDAKAKADKGTEEIMNDAFGGMSLPPGFKLPF